jgi:thiamine biosynthesis lipoprotein
MHLTEHVETKMALGSDVSIAVVSDNEARSQLALTNTWRSIFAFERQFSRFIPQSELSTFNATAGRRTTISEAFRKQLIAAKTIGQRTGGLYNPFILPALQRSGYLKSAAPGYEHDTVDDYSGRGVADLSELQIGEGWAQIPFNTAIDLGGCGKGYLADQLRSELIPYNLAGYVLTFGGDIATYGVNQAAAPWTIFIQDAQNLASTLETMILCPQTGFGVATSGTFRRTGHTGNSWHHIIDPSTLKPALTDIRLATVCAETTLEADVLASCAVILGSTKAPDFLRSQGIKQLLLQCESAHSRYHVEFGFEALKSKPLQAVPAS